MLSHNPLNPPLSRPPAHLTSPHHTLREDELTGATLRMGRHISGNVEFLRDVVNEDPDQLRSVLIVGPPGAGKTTIIRELARLLSSDLSLSVLIIDTSNEIAGDGNVVHRSVGHSRRMMVKTRDDQAAVMIEGVQNHTYVRCPDHTGLWA